MRWRPLLVFLLLTACATPAPVIEEVTYRVIDRRRVDGTVVLVRQVPPRKTGTTPFLSARFWDLTPSAQYYRVRDAGVGIPARRVGPSGDPPAVTLRGGEVAPTSWTNLFGGHAWTRFETGEIVRLARLNTAFKTVRMDVESVCRPREVGKRLQGRVDFVLSGQVGAATLEEANAAVGALLEPLDLSRVLETCDPRTGQPPVALRIGMPAGEIRDRLGPPRERSTAGDVTILDYGSVRLRIRDGRIAAIAVPAVD